MQLTLGANLSGYRAKTELNTSSIIDKQSVYSAHQKKIANRLVLIEENNQF
jgi:hypothetical protein